MTTLATVEHSALTMLCFSTAQQAVTVFAMKPATRMGGGQWRGVDINNTIEQYSKWQQRRKTNLFTTIIP